MIPLKDINPRRKFPYVTVLLIGLNLVVFIYELSLGSTLQALFYHYGIIPQNVVSGFSAFQINGESIVPFLSSLFLHGGFLHLAGNMLYLWVFGDNVEDKFGHLRFLAFYLLCGIIASLSHIVIEPTSTIPTIGASGAISGVLGAYVLIFPRARVVTLIPIFIFFQLAELPALIVIGFWFVMQFFNGMLSLGVETSGMGGVAWWAHIGGFVAGISLVIPFRKFR